jgi:photosystem II stability/assembly factor-like uncharacterized protein
MPFDRCAGACGPVVSIDFLDARRGWISYVRGGAGGLAATDDGGTTWNVLPQPPVLGPIHFVDAQHGWLTGKEQPGAIFRTTDGGASWTFVGPADASATTISAPVFFGTGTIVAAAINEYQTPERMTVTRSSDGGGSWTVARTPVEGDVVAHDPTDDRFTATSPSDWILIDGERLYVTKDAGAHWTTLRPTHTRLREVAFTSRTEGWLLADIPDCGDQITECSDQYLYGTVDGGRTWTLRSPTAGITANRSP